MKDLRRRLKELLSETAPNEEGVRIHSSYDVIGDIAIIRLTDGSEKHRAAIAEAIMDTHKNVQTVLAQTGAVQGSFRLRRLEHVGGIIKTVAVHKEYGCLFRVDVEQCYFSPRLLCERMRIADQVGKGEVVVNMFAGVGCFSILIAKYSEACRVYSIDVNPVAVQCMQHNVRMNRVYGRVIPMLGDAKEIVEKSLRHIADRVLLPLPEKALKYLPQALLALKGTGGWVHFYDFEHAAKGEDPIEKASSKVTKRLEGLGVAGKISWSRVVRSTGPNWYQVVLDIELRRAKSGIADMVL